MVLDMHGVSLMQCIKSTFRLRKDTETFGARATAAKVNINRLLKDVTTMDEVKEKLEMWLTLSSYGDECIAAVLKDQPQNRRELAQAICRIEEVNPQGRPSYQGYRPTYPCGNQYNNPYHNDPSSQYRQEQPQEGRQQNQGFQPRQHNSSITTNRDRLSLTSRVLHSNNSKLMAEITGLTSSQGVLSVKTRDTKLDPAPIKAKATRINYIPRNLSGAWGSIDPAPRKFLMSSKV